MIDELDIMPPELPEPPQVSPALTCPAPSASPELVARWLRKVRTGAMCGLAVVVIHAARLVLWAIGITPGPRLANVIVCAAYMAGGVSVWLLVSSEPHNRRWLWPCRWGLRLAAGAIVLLCGSSIVVYGFFRSLPEPGVNDSAWDKPMAAGVVGGWMLLYWYLKTLSHRLGDKALRKNFVVLSCLCSVVLVFFLAVLAGTSGGWTRDDSVEAPSATAPADAQMDGSGPNLLGFSFWMAYYVWMGWLMWRLSRRLNQLAGHYQKLCGLAPTKDERPG